MLWHMYAFVFLTVYHPFWLCFWSLLLRHAILPGRVDKANSVSDAASSPSIFSSLPVVWLELGKADTKTIERGGFSQHVTSCEITWDSDQSQILRGHLKINVRRLLVFSRRTTSILLRTWWHGWNKYQSIDKRHQLFTLYISTQETHLHLTDEVRHV